VPTVPQGETNRGRDIVLRGELRRWRWRAFGTGQAGVVLGGRFADLALARLADRNGRVLRFDPTTGLFGFRGGRCRRRARQPDMRARWRWRSTASGWCAASPRLAAADRAGAGGRDDLPTARSPDWARRACPARIANAARSSPPSRGGDEDRSGCAWLSPRPLARVSCSR
jgi:peptide/nickel transport system substrate-binding protein